MSRSPQNGGFHRCTGGGPVRVADLAASVIASRPLLPLCPAFAIVCLEPVVVTAVFHAIVIARKLIHCRKNGQSGVENAMIFKRSRSLRWIGRGAIVADS